MAKEEIVSSHAKGLGSSDAKMVYTIGKEGFINETQRQRIAIMLGLEKQIEFSVKATEHGNKIEAELFDYFKEISPNAVSNPYYEAVELTEKYGFAVFNHIDYEILSDNASMWYELKSVNDSVEETLKKYECQIEWHNMIMRSVHPTKTKTLFLLHYHTENKDDSFNGENLTKHVIQPNTEIQFFIQKGLQIISDCIKEGFSYTPKAEQDKVELSEKIQNGELVPEKVFVRIIEPKEFGLQDNTEIQNIEKAFIPKVFERELLAEQYKVLISKEITPDLCKDAHELSKKLTKVRTGIAEVHKTQKAFFLQAGKFVDAWKNKETLPIEQMEAKLEEIRHYYANIEKERIAKIKADRIAQLALYTSTPEMYNSELLTDESFTELLTGLRLAKEQKNLLAKQAEQAEEERKTKELLHQNRKGILAPFWNFLDENEQSFYFGDMQEDVFENIRFRAETSKIEADTIIENQRLENERLKQELANKQKKEAEEKQLKIDTYAEILVENGYEKIDEETWAKHDLFFKADQLARYNDEEFSTQYNEIEEKITAKIEKEKKVEGFIETLINNGFTDNNNSGISWSKGGFNATKSQLAELTQEQFDSRIAEIDNIIKERKVIADAKEKAEKQLLADNLAYQAKMTRFQNLLSNYGYSNADLPKGTVGKAEFTFTKEEIAKMSDSELINRLEANDKILEERERVENALKMPYKAKMSTWVESFEIGVPNGIAVDDIVLFEITKRFEEFKEWAIEKIKTV